MAAKSGWNAPCEVFLQWRSPTAATRISLSFLRLDRSGPVRDFLGGHLSVRQEPPIRIAPARYIRQVLLPREQGYLTETLIGRRLPRVTLEETAQTEHDLLRNGRALAGVDEAEQGQVAQKNPPVRAEPRHQAAPVEPALTGSNQVGDVSPVIALTLHDERFGPDHLLGRAQPDRHAQHGGRPTICKPLVVDLGEAVPRAIDHIDVVGPDTCLAEPVGERKVRLETGLRQPVQECHGIPPAHEDIQVLRAAHASRVMTERVAAADEEWDLEPTHEQERPAMTLAACLPARARSFRRSRVPDGSNGPHEITAKSSAGIRASRM